MKKLTKSQISHIDNIRCQLECISRLCDDWKDAQYNPKEHPDFDYTEIFKRLDLAKFSTNYLLG